MLDILIINGIIITMDRDHSIYHRGYLGIEKGCIACLGPMESLSQLPPATRTIDVHGHPVLPGLIDGHTHRGHCLTKTMAEHLGGDSWESLVESIYYRYSDEDFWYTEGALAAAEHLKFGVTTSVAMVGNTPRIDRLWPITASLEGSVSVGIRQFTGIGAANGPWPKIARTYQPDGRYEEYPVTPDQCLATTEEAVRTLNGCHPRQNCLVAPGRMGFRSWESVADNIAHNQQMFRIAQQYNVPLHAHAYGGDVQFLADHTPHVLTPKLSLTHSTGYSQQELEILARTGVYVFHGPTTHAHINRRCPVMEMLDMGINLAVITDGTSPDRSFDLWRDMKNVQLLQRAHFNDSSLLPCGKVLELVTIEPAKALGIDHLVGSLEVGKRADIISLNTDQPHLAPFGIMPIQRLVYHAMGQDVDLVLVDGEIMMEGRTLTQIDETSLLRRVSDVFETTMSRSHHSLQEVCHNPHLFDLRQ